MESTTTVRGLAAATRSISSRCAARQVDPVPVGALGLAHAAHEDQRDVAGLRERHRLGQQVLVLGGLVLR